MADFDIVPDGSPVETPEAGAAAAYEGIPATTGQALGAEALSTMSSAMRVGEQGQYQGSGWFSRFLYGATTNAALSDGAIPQDEIPGAGTVPAPLLSPNEYNAKYAPIGNDGKPVSLGTDPLPDPVAKLIGEAKTDEIKRENILSRYQDAHSWPTNFAIGTLGFMLDPLRASTAFVPEIGEEAILARVGTGLAGRTAARLGAGALGGVAAGAGVAGLEYGLGTQEASDYSLREAFRDMAFGAAGFAIGHAAFGGAGEALRYAFPRREELPGTVPAPVIPPTAVPPTVEPLGETAAPILEADAQTQHAAIGTAVAQLAEGRPVEVEPYFGAEPKPEIIGRAEFIGPHTDASGATDLAAAADALVNHVSQALDDGRPVTLYADGTPVPIVAVNRGMMQDAAGQRWGTMALATDHNGSNRVEIGEAAGAVTPADVAAQQALLYREGFAPEISSDDLREVSASVYEPPAPVPEAAPAAVEQQAREPALPGMEAAPGTETAPAAAEAPAQGTPAPAYTPVPRAPMRLASFLKSKGGLQDQGGEISHILGRDTRARPGFISAKGMPLDEAALQAWEAGYLPGAERPDTNALVDALHDDLNGRARYSEKAAQEVEDYHTALARNTEVDRLSSETGIEARGKTRDQFFDELAGHMSLDRAARESEEIATAHEATLAEAERRAAEWANARGEAWEPDHDVGQPRTLEDMEDAYRQEEALGWPAEGAPSPGGPGPAGRGEGAVQAVAGPGERGAGIGRSGLPASERTEQGDQLILPGGERSAVQAAAGREAAGRGMLRTERPQAAPGELFEFAQQAQERLAQPDLLPEERSELETALGGLDTAQRISDAMDEAGACLTEGGA